MAAKIPQAGEVDADWGLLARAAGGDGDAFTALVERHQERLVGLCSRWLGGREEARDAAQEIFLKVFRHAERVEPRGRFFTWLYRIAINHCLNQVRRQKIARFFSLQGMAGGREGAATAGFDPPDGRPDAETELLARERWRRTRECLDRLPENQRVVVVLARFEGLSGREIAATLGITEGAVESRLVRAMRRLSPQEARAPGVPVKEGGVG
ncbi:MAG: sigma-70 family RNA polymerase sigma factor [Thermoanaerobaculia bacterium]